MTQTPDSNGNPSTEHRILSAAEREFIDKGYDGARTTSIAAAAGVTHTMLHYYFRTKENLFRHILEEKVKFLKGMMLDRLFERDEPLLATIESAIASHQDFLASNPDFPRFMLTVLAGRPEFADAFREIVNSDYHDTMKVLQEKIDHSARLGECRRVDARMLILDIISLNAFTFIGLPLVNVLVDVTPDADFIEQRKKNNVELIMLKLKP